MQTQQCLSELMLNQLTNVNALFGIHLLNVGADCAIMEVSATTHTLAFCKLINM